MIAREMTLFNRKFSQDYNIKVTSFVTELWVILRATLANNG
jgi:hypothetical protein